MVLGLVFDYATQNVRSNAVRAIHQLVECVANAHPAKTLDRFLPFCDRSIRTELEHGASSLRITSSGSTPLPSDATLHWSKLHYFHAREALTYGFIRPCHSAGRYVQVSVHKSSPQEDS